MNKQTVVNESAESVDSRQSRVDIIGGGPHSHVWVQEVFPEGNHVYAEC